MTDTDRLRAIAQAATPGPWWNDVADDTFGQSEHFVASKDRGRQVCSYCSDPDESADAEYIATFDPLLVAAMLDVVLAAEETPGWDENLSSALDRFREIQP